MTDGALVLAGGGLAGIAWETGVLLGIQDVEPEVGAAIVSAPNTLVGTSAGSVVAAQLSSGTPLTDLFEAQLAERHSEIGADVDFAEFGARLAALREGVTSPEEFRRRLGALAREADTVPASARIAVMESRLPSHEWGERRLLIPAVDIESGDLRVFDRLSGVPLTHAVAASCAVPGVWPVVPIDGHLYMDGGVRTIANSDLAKGASPILILVPSAAESPLGVALPQEELDALEPGRVHVVYADDESIAAYGTNPLDPSVRKASALAGREQGRRIAAAVAEFWRAG
jgi:NTE family protein